MEAAASTAAGAATKEVVAPFVRAFVEEFVSPIIAREKARKSLSAALKKYPAVLERRTRHIPTIAVQGSQFELEKVYEPVTLRDPISGSDSAVSKFPSRLIPPSKRLLVVDSAGMGKSTFSKFLARCSLKECKFFPVMIELRKLRSDQRLVDFLCEEILGAPPNTAFTLEAEKAFSSGGFLFLLDGLDEVEEELRPRVNQEICTLAVEFHLCPVVLTSRPDKSLASFQSFKQYTIRPLSLDQAYSLLHRYDHGRNKAVALIDKVDALPEIHALLENPLMVTLLYRAYDYKATIPLKRGIFFRQVFEALYQDHDLSKEGAYERRKKSDLDLDDFQRFMRALGIITSTAGRVQYDSASFMEHLTRAIDLFRSPSIGVHEISKDLLSAVPIMVRDGTDVRWAHKAFQDYFAAEFVVRDLEEERACKFIKKLLSGANPGRHENLLSIVAEANLGLLRKAFVNDHFAALAAWVDKAGSVTEAEFSVFAFQNLGDFYFFQPERARTMELGSSRRKGDVLDDMRKLVSKKLRELQYTGAAHMFGFVEADIGVLAIPSERWELWRALSAIDPSAFRPASITSMSPKPDDFSLVSEVLGELDGVVGLEELFKRNQSPQLRVSLARCMSRVFPGRIPSLSSVAAVRSESSHSGRDKALEDILFGS